VVKNILLSIMAILVMLSFSCITASKDSDWVIEWEFKNALDSAAVFQNTTFYFENSMSPTQRKGQVDSLGKLQIVLVMPGLDDEVIENNPSLYCSVIDVNDTVFDTTLYWNELEFQQQYSQYYEEDKMYVSKKIFYIQ